MRAERIGEDGVWQPVKNCVIKAALIEERKKRALKIVVEPEHALIHNAFNKGYADFKQLVGMNSQDAKQLHRDFLRAVHPDKFDTSRMSEVQRTNWHLMMNGVAKIIEDIGEQIRFTAEHSVGGLEETEVESDA